jgi:ribose 5-phosphate isomerase A
VSADALRRAAGEEAVARYVRDDMRLGLGTGSTATAMIEALAARLVVGALRGVCGVPTSEATADLCRRLDVPLTTLAETPQLDVVIDGADEIDPDLDLIKGLGGAHLREKVVEFALPVCERALRALGWEPTRRTAADRTPFVTDEGNAILDCRREDWTDAAALAAAVKAVPGVVEHGFFLGLATAAVVGTADGIRVLERGSRPAAVP